MKYSHVVNYVARELWAIEPEKLTEIVSALAFRAAGGELTAEEIQARIGDRGQPIVSQGRDVAVIPIRGTISHRGGGMAESSGGTSAEGIERMLAQASADPNVGTILLDVDSPGGTVTGIKELAAKIYDVRGKGKRTVALVNGMAASAAYWLASQADEIVSIPSGVSGSIGVYLAHADLSAALEKEGVKMTLISAGKYKVDGGPFEPLSDEARATFQARVDEVYGWFVADVARGRGVDESEVRKGFGEGRAVGAKAALGFGLIDSIATVDATLSRLVGKSETAMRASVVETELAAEDDLRRRLEMA